MKHAAIFLALCLAGATEFSARSQESATSTAPKALPPLPPIPKARLAGERPVRPLGRPVTIPNSNVQNPRAPGLEFPPAPLANPGAQFTGVPTSIPQPAGLSTASAPSTVPMPEGVLLWKTDVQEYHIKTGETNAHFVFSFTNASPSNVVVTAVRTSCGCTAVNMPALPWTVKKGETAEIGVDVDVRRKVGTLSKPVTVETSLGYKVLTTRVHIPHQVNGDPSQFPGTDAERKAERARNLALAAQDRQKVFKGECAVCHVEPTKGQMGATLFTAACAICHEGPNRASMVPDIAENKSNIQRDKAYWTALITKGGKEGGLMPAFALEEGGPLSADQIRSLADFLVMKYPSTAAAAAGGATP